MWFVKTDLLFVVDDRLVSEPTLGQDGGDNNVGDLLSTYVVGVHETVELRKEGVVLLL